MWTKKYLSTYHPGLNYQGNSKEVVNSSCYLNQDCLPDRNPEPSCGGSCGWLWEGNGCDGQRALTGSLAARCCLAPSCPEAERTLAWLLGHWVRELGRGSGSAGWSVSSCWGSWQTSGDGTECGCEGEAEGASESTGCGGLEDLEREEGETAIRDYRL